MQIRFLMLVISLAVMGSISQSKSTAEDHRGRLPWKVPWKVPRKVLRKVTVEGGGENENLI